MGNKKKKRIKKHNLAMLEYEVECDRMQGGMYKEFAKLERKRDRAIIAAIVFGVVALAAGIVRLSI